jgi:hypothetical protein
MSHLLGDRSHLTRSCALALGALVLSAVTTAAPASAADPSAPVAEGLIAGTSAAGVSTHTDIVLSNVGPATVPAETRVDASVTRGGEPVVVGQVQFSINGKQFGAAVPVQDGMASLSVIQGVPGTYTISARYAGYADDALNLDASASGKAVFEAVPPGTGCVGGTTCDGTTVWGSDDDEPSGVIVISTPYTETSPLMLPPLTLQRSATCIQDPLEYATDAPFSGISISDTREGSRPWTASVQSEDLLLDGQTATTATTQQRIDGQNVGLSHLALTSTSAAPQTISTPRPAGSGNLGLPINFTIFDNPSAEHVQGDASGTLGLGGSPKRVIHANRGFGTSMFVGTLTITAPTNTVQGTYLGKLTFTVLGS